MANAPHLFLQITVVSAAHAALNDGNKVPAPGLDQSTFVIPDPTSTMDTNRLDSEPPGVLANLD